MVKLIDCIMITDFSETSSNVF